mgnify:CR=1 FL=1
MFAPENQYKLRYYWALKGLNRLFGFYGILRAAFIVIKFGS